MAVATIVTFAFRDGGSSSPGGVRIEYLDTPTPRQTFDSALDPAPTATATVSSAAVTGYAMPVAGACLPESDALLPGAPREYRDGVHEGVDFYDDGNCILIGIDTEVLAAKAGTVVRADLDYVDLTLGELAELEAMVESGEGNEEDVLDAYRGRQVWIDHGGGELTRYAHLNGIAGIAVGDRVEQGELIAYVGESGSPESVTDPGTEVHLHFEIRLGESYLGAGLPLEQVRELYELAFGL